VRSVALELEICDLVVAIVDLPSLVGIVCGHLPSCVIHGDTGEAVGSERIRSVPSSLTMLEDAVETRDRRAVSRHSDLQESGRRSGKLALVPILEAVQGEHQCPPTRPPSSSCAEPIAKIPGCIHCLGTATAVGVASGTDDPSRAALASSLKTNPLNVPWLRVDPPSRMRQLRDRACSAGSPARGNIDSSVPGGRREVVVRSASAQPSSRSAGDQPLPTPWCSSARPYVATSTAYCKRDSLQ
jgi:hypothetical protein